MAKERTSVSLEQDVYEYLRTDGTNASELVNKLVKQHMQAGASEHQILDFRIQQVESEVEELESRLEQKEEQLSELRARKKSLTRQKQEKKQSQLQEAKAALVDVPHRPENTAIKHWADKLNLSPDELIEKLGEME